MTDVVAQDATGRGRLLDRVVEHLLASGSVTESLRATADAVGSSHRMLNYHFGGRAGLIDAVVTEVALRLRAELGGVAGKPGSSPADASWSVWKRVSATDLAPLVRLSFTLQARLLETGEFDAAAALSAAWHEPVVELLVQRGTGRAQARKLARLELAVYRGLLLDLPVTGDRRAADAAVRACLAAVLGD